MASILPIFRREFWGYFRSPVAYVFIIIFLVSTAGSSWYLGGFYRSNDATLELFFFFHPWLYLILVPAVGMRLWSEELRSGSIELLLTLPVHLPWLVIAKFLAAWGFIGVALLLTFPMVLTVYYLGSPDGGVMLSGYLGSFLLAGTYLAITSFTSTLTKNQVISFIISFLICIVMVMLGWGVLTQNLESWVPRWLADAINSFGFITHFDGLRRGLIDFRDIVYFISWIGVMLWASVMVLERKRSVS